MKALLVPIGNSRGVRIPKPLIEQCGLTDEVDLDVQDGTILIRAPRVGPRAGWTKAFARMAREGGDKLEENHFPSTQWDKDEWAWQ
jgi:antitoxin MazE